MWRIAGHCVVWRPCRRQSKAPLYKAPGAPDLRPLSRRHRARGQGRCGPDPRRLPDESRQIRIVAFIDSGSARLPPRAARCPAPSLRAAPAHHARPVLLTIRSIDRRSRSRSALSQLARCCSSSVRQFAMPSPADDPAIGIGDPARHAKACAGTKNRHVPCRLQDWGSLLGCLQRDLLLLMKWGSPWISTANRSPLQSSQPRRPRAVSLTSRRW